MFQSPVTVRMRMKLSRLLTLQHRRGLPQLGYREFGSNQPATPPPQQWDSAISAAEKVVGYPTSFMNLRFWLSDEMSNVAVNMRKLIGTKHPLMKTAKGLLFDNKENMQTRGLVVLLMSKAGGYPEKPAEFLHHELDNEYKPLSDHDLTSENSNGILSTQRSLAEITEMINTSFILHKGIMDIDLSDKKKPFDTDTDDLLYGNKMALLSGDYLLAKASVGLSALGNTYVVEIMASAIADLMESRFFLHDLQTANANLQLDIGQWQELCYKNGGCLYAKSCQSALMLSEHSKSVANQAFRFGKHFGVLRQLKADLDDARFSLEHPTESICTILSANQINSFKSEHVESAVNCLNTFQNKEASNALENIVYALSENIVT